MHTALILILDYIIIASKHEFLLCILRHKKLLLCTLWYMQAYCLNSNYTECTCALKGTYFMNFHLNLRNVKHDGGINTVN